MPFEQPVGAETTSGRLHPSSLLFSLGSAARRLLLPGVLILFASRGSNLELWLMLLFFPAAVASLLRYWSYRYRLAPDDLVIREGVVTRNERHIPYARIQNINLVQNPLHRALGVAEVRLETAGGDEPEAVMRVLSRQAIERLRENVFRDREERKGAAAVAASGGEGVEDAALVRLPTGEVVLFGLLSNRGMAVVAAAMGAIWQFDLFEFEDGRLTFAGFEVEVPEVPNPGLVAGLAFGAAALIAAFALLRLFSVLLALLKFHGFSLRGRGEDLRAEYGLLTRISATIPRQRIQLLSTRAAALQRWCGRAAVQVETAGGAQAGGGSGVDRLWLAPLIRRERIDELLQRILPEIRMDAVVWRPIPRRARRRVFVRSLIVLLLATAVALPPFGKWGLILLAVGLPLVWLNAKLYVKHTAYALTENAVLYRSGWWVRRMSVVRFAKIQALRLGQSPFDRRHDMASVQVDTAGARRVGHRVQIAYLEAAVARRILATLYDEASRRAFRW
jgi:putative membrane protein